MTNPRTAPQRPVCAVPGCDAVLARDNKSGCCACHQHAAECHCKQCTGRSRLGRWTQVKIVAIRQDHHDGLPIGVIAAREGRDRDEIRKIVSGKNYTWCGGPIRKKPPAGTPSLNASLAIAARAALVPPKGEGFTAETVAWAQANKGTLIEALQADLKRRTAIMEARMILVMAADPAARRPVVAP